MLTSREAKELRALRTTKGREETGRFIAEGIRVVEDLLASHTRVSWAVTASSLEDTLRGAKLVEELGLRQIEMKVLPDREFEGLSATEAPQGVLAVGVIPRYSLEELSPGADRSVVLVLDAVQDPGNFGTLVRSAEALGARAVVALPGTVDPWNPKSVRAAAGSSFRMPILELGTPEALEGLRSAGYLILGSAAEGRAVTQIRGNRVALVVGNEGAGLSASTRSMLDEVAGIPLRGRAESLNVAAAAAILLYELTR